MILQFVPSFLISGLTARFERSAAFYDCRNEAARLQVSRSLEYTGGMQLRNARLCLDCEEVHEAEQCPICASEMFASITRWVPAPERRARPRTNPANERTDAYRALLDSETRPSTTRRLLKHGALGLTAVGLIGWFVRQNRSREARAPESRSDN